jgi:hypothetical protein
MNKKTQENTVKKKDKESKDTKDAKSTKKTVTRLLLCKLSDKELAKAGVELDANMSKIEGKEAEKKAAVDAIKADVELLEGVTIKLRSILKSGGEEREVNCEETTDYRMGEVRVKRLDTGEVFQRRTMAQSEYQLPLEAQKPSGKLLPMDGGKGKQEPVEEMGCVECWGTGKVKIGEPPLDAKCEVCNGSGRVPVKPDPLKATLGDVAAQHAKNKADAEQAGAGGEGHPEVEKLLKKRGRGKGKKGDEEGPPIDPETGEPAAF